MPLADVGKLLLASVEQAVTGPDDVGLTLAEVIDQRRDQVPRLVVEHREVGAGLRLAGDQVAQ